MRRAAGPDPLVMLRACEPHSWSAQHPLCRRRPSSADSRRQSPLLVTLVSCGEVGRGEGGTAVVRVVAGDPANHWSSHEDHQREGAPELARSATRSASCGC